MWTILRERNQALVDALQRVLDALQVARRQGPAALGPYTERLIALCQAQQALIQRNLLLVNLAQPDVLEDVLSDTKQAVRITRLLSSRLVTPVLRSAPHDRLCLATIEWLHRTHPQTTRFPPAFADGTCGVWPFLALTPIYFFPSLEQRSLLYQPLLFHEFGHLLYACHKREMDDLVGDLQRQVRDTLVPASERNDQHALHQAAEREAIVAAWYSWAQELFCDAVGLTMGGPCFLRSFSTYLSTLERGDFYRDPNELRQSKHPLTWLRVKFLVSRARAANIPGCDAVEQEWLDVAGAMRIQEDYHGFYTSTLSGPVTQTLDDMLTEAHPRPCAPDEAAGGGWDASADALVRLLNWAWQVYESTPDTYATWEAQQLASLLGPEPAAP